MLLQVMKLLRKTIKDRNDICWIDVTVFHVVKLILYGEYWVRWLQGESVFSWTV